MINPRIFTSLDLEMNQPSGKIIQIGAVVGDIKTGEILDELCVETAIDEPVTDYITKLTGITQQQLDVAVSLQEGYELLKALHKKHGSFINPIVWGGADSICLRDQMGFAEEDRYMFGRRWIDAKTVFLTHALKNDIPMTGGLSKSMNKLGLKFDGRKHNAMADALNTFLVYHYLINQ